MIYCNNKSRNSVGISYFTMLINIDRRSKWIELCLPEYIDKHVFVQNLRICSEHFEDKMFLNVNKKNRLTDFAVPTLFSDDILAKRESESDLTMNEAHDLSTPMACSSSISCTSTMTMNINPISNYSVDEGYRIMLSVFRSNDLRILLGTFGQSTAGQKSELIDRAIVLLRTRPANINFSAYTAKIHEIYRFLQSGMSSYNIMIRSSLIQNRQQQPQRMYQPPLFPQPSMHMARVVLPQVMPQRQGINYIRCIAVGPSKIRCIESNQLHPNQQMSIVAQDALEVGTTASGNNSYTPSIETVAQIKYKKLPFYDVIDEVIKPTLLTGTDTCTLPNVHEGMKEAIFKFTLSPEQANFVASNRNISPGKKEYLYQFQIRICQFIEPVPNESPDYMPLDLYIRVNRNPCQLPPSLPITSPGTKSRLTARPIDCTANVKLCPFVSNTITIRWTPDGKNYVFSMYLVKKLTSDTLIKRLHDKGGRSSEDTRNIIIQMFTNIDPDIATTSHLFSLICPLSKVRMKIPAKSIYCDHLQCFDVSTFILMNEKKATWMCPTCNKPCLYDDIQIENYFLEVVSSPTLKYCTTEIEILSDGTWRIHKETIETKNTNSTFDMVKPSDIVDLDSDDEMCTERNAGPSPKNSKSSFIDLTLSDDEGPQAQVQLQQAITSSEQGVVNQIDSPSPISSSTPTTEAS